MLETSAWMVDSCLCVPKPAASITDLMSLPRKAWNDGWDMVPYSCGYSSDGGITGGLRYIPVDA